MTEDGHPPPRETAGPVPGSVSAMPDSERRNNPRRLRRPRHITVYGRIVAVEPTPRM